MKSKRIILLIAIVLSMIILGSIAVFAKESSIRDLILMKRKKISREDAVSSIVTLDEKNATITEQEAVELAKKYEENLTIDYSLKNDDERIKLGNFLKLDKYADKTYWEIETSYAHTTLDATTGELILTLSKKENYEKYNGEDKEVNQIAENLFNNLKINDTYKEYKLNGIEKFDDELWMANFSKDYDGLKNNFESVKLVFSPANKEIKIVSIIENGTFENNTIEITEEQAIKTAKEKVTTDAKYDVDVEIVMPNYFFEDSEDYLLYKKNNNTRKAFVVRFDNEEYTTVYVDATTGEIIGGDIVL